MDIYSLMNTWADQGVFSVLIPLLLFYSVIYALLSQTSFIKGASKSIVSLGISLLATYGVTTQQYGGKYLYEFVPVITGYSGIFIAGILFLTMFPAVMGFSVQKFFGTDGEGKKSARNIAALVILVPLMIYYYVRQPAVDESLLYSFVFLIIVGGVISYTSGSAGKKADAPAPAANDKEDE